MSSRKTMKPGCSECGFAYASKESSRSLCKSCEIAALEADLARLKQMTPVTSDERAGLAQLLEEAVRERDEARAERDARADFMDRRGYRRCDIPACNCGSWHGGNAQDRLSEIATACEWPTSWTDEHGVTHGETVLDAVLRTVASLAAAEAENARLREAAQKVEAQWHNDCAHSGECAYNDQPDGLESDEACDCGWPDLRGALAAAPQEEGGGA